MLLVVIAFVLFLLMGLPVAFAIGISGALFFIQHPELPFTIPVQVTVSQTQNFALLAVPLFILAGNFMNKSGITERLLDLDERRRADEQPIAHASVLLVVEPLYDPHLDHRALVCHRVAANAGRGETTRQGAFPEQVLAGADFRWHRLITRLTRAIRPAELRPLGLGNRVGAGHQQHHQCSKSQAHIGHREL